MPLIELVSSDIKQAIERFEQFHKRFAQYFATKMRTMAHRAKQFCNAPSDTPSKRLAEMSHTVATGLKELFRTPKAKQD